MSKLDDALKRFEQVATLGMRESDYRQVDDSLALFKEDLAVFKTVLSKKDELLGLYRKHINNLCKQEREGVKNSLFSSEFVAYELYEQIKQKEKELGEMK